MIGQYIDDDVAPFAAVPPVAAAYPPPPIGVGHTAAGAASSAGGLLIDSAAAAVGYNLTDEENATATPAAAIVAGAVTATAAAAAEDIIMSEIWLRVVFIVLYCVIFLVGIAGNSLVLHVVARNRAMQTITNLFITNLAVSDIMMCLLAVPFTPASAMLQSWIFGETL